MRTEGGEEDEAAGREDGAGLVPYYPYPPPYDRVSEDDLRGAGPSARIPYMGYTDILGIWSKRTLNVRAPVPTHPCVESQ